MRLPSMSISIGQRRLGTRAENRRISGTGVWRPPPKEPDMPTMPPVENGAISRPSSESASFWSCLAAIFTITSRASSARLCGP